MSTTYTIVFENLHGEKGRYGVFTEPPVVDNSATVYSNVWMSFVVPIGGTFKTLATTNYYAWVGTAPVTPAPGVVVETGDSAIVTLGTDKSPGTTIPMVVDDGVVSLEVDQETRTALAGAFEIDTGSDFTTPNTKYLLGLGKHNQMGLVGPTACILADNNSVTNIFPVVKFYVAESNYKAGSVVNFSIATEKAALIDFTSAEANGRTTALVIHRSNGGFDVTYEDSAATARILERNAARNKALRNMSDSAKLKQLQNKLYGLYTLLDSLGFGRSLEHQSLPWAWIGKIGWPTVTAIAAVTTGANYIAQALINKGYQCKHTETVNPDKSKTSTFYIGPDKEDSIPGSEDINADWINAVKADTQSDGHKNLGVHPISIKEAKMIGEARNGKPRDGDIEHVWAPLDEC